MFLAEKAKSLDGKDLIEACKGDDTSKWDDCFGEELNK